MSGRLVAAVGAAVTALVGAAEHAAGHAEQPRQVILQARPTNLGPVQNAFLSGAVSSGRTGESVTLQARDCGLTTFRNVAVIRTGPGGRWTQEYGPGVNTTLRAVWKGVRSAPVALRQAPRLQLDRRSASTFEVGVGSLGRMWRKKVSFQRRQGSTWITVKRVVLTETYSTPGLGSGTWTEAEFTASVPQGSVVRALLPLSEARPCYLAGVSNTVRT